MNGFPRNRSLARGDAPPDRSVHCEENGLEANLGSIAALAGVFNRREPAPEVLGGRPYSHIHWLGAGVGSPYIVRDQKIARLAWDTRERFPVSKGARSPQVLLKPRQGKILAV